MALEESDKHAQSGKAASVAAPGTGAPPHIPDHELLRRIGGGSYGEVWLARNIMGTFRAVKMVYRRNFQDERPYEREFSGIQKFEPLSRSHEGLVDVLQMGRNEEAGYFYYVMELADCALLGGTACRFQQAESPSAPDAAGAAPDRVTCLESCVGCGSEQYRPATARTAIADHGRLPFEQCLSIGLAMTSALEHLHRHGLVHRDVKPSNIIFVNGIPKLADIGLVTGTDATVSFVGTEGFIPPEGPGTVQADIFGLGKVLYELTTGKDRHDFPEPATLLGEFADRAELLELDEVIQKACAADPRQRYGSAAQMEEDLLLVKTGKSVRDKHALERRLKLMTRAGAVATVVLMLGAVAYVLAVREVGVAKAAAKREAGLREQAEQATLDTKAARRQERKLRVQADAQAKKAETEAAKSQQVAQFLKDMLKAVNPSVALGRDTTMLREILDKTAQSLSQDLTNQPEVEMKLRGILAGTYRDLGLFKQMEQMARESLRVGRARLGEEHPAVAEALYWLGDAQVALGRLDEAEGSIREALARHRKLQGNESTDVATSLNSLALLLWKKGRPDEAEPMFREALAIERKLRGNEHRFIATYLNNLALVLRDQRKLDEAAQVFREALALDKKVCGEESPAVMLRLNNLALVLSDQGKLDEAEAFDRKALALARKLLGEEHPDVAWSLSNLGGVLRRKGNLDEAETLERQALAMRRKLFGNEHPDVAESINSLAATLGEQGKLPEAVALGREGLAMRRKLLGNEHPSVATSLASLASLLEDEGKPAEAEPLYREALAVRRKLLSNDHPSLVGSLAALATVLLDQGKSAEAEPLARECLAIREKTMPEDWRMFNTRSLLGGSLLGQKKYAEAEPLLLSGYDGMKQREDKIPADGKARLKEALQRLVELYEATAQPDKAAEWKQKLAEFDKAATQKQAKALIQGGAETNGPIKSATSIASPSPSPVRP